MAQNITSKTFSILSKTGDYYLTYQATSGGPPPIPVGQTVNWDQLYTDWLASIKSPSAVTRYVSFATGNDTTGDGTQGNPWKTLNKGCATMNAGDELIITDTGTITNEALMKINDVVGTVKSGLSRTARTIIRAQTRFGLTLKTDTALAANSQSINLSSATNVVIDGINVEMNNVTTYSNVNFAVVVNGQYNTLSRCLVRRNAGSQYGGLIECRNYYNLLQDVHGCGAMRYGIQMGASNVGAPLGGKNVIRRSIVRFDYTNTAEPKSAFSHYGNESTFNSGETEFQNCFAVDGQYVLGNGAGVGTEGVYAGIYHPKAAYNIRHRGCAAINNGAWSGLHTVDFPAANTLQLNPVVVDCLAWGKGNPAYGSTMRGIRGQSNSGSYNRLTVGGGIEQAFGSGAYGIAPTNSNSSTTPSSLLYDPNGANLKWVYGEFGTTFGETGYDLVTNVPLWQFPYEAEIRDWFRACPSPAANHYPVSFDATRGFCAANQTFTRYLAGYTGSNATTILEGLYS